MKKFLLSLLALMSVAAAKADIITFEGPGSWTTEQAAQSETKDGITISTTQGVGAAATDTYPGQYRIYKNQTFTATSTIGNITKIEFTCTANGDAKYGPGNFTDATAGSYTFEASGKLGTWTGDAATISMVASLNQVRASKIVVYTGEDGNGTVTPDPGTDPTEEFDASKYEERTVDQFLAEKNTTTAYKVTGIVNKIANSTYGNFYLGDLDDPATEIYVYGVVKPEDQTNNKVWSELGVTIGDEITIVGTYVEYNGTPEIKNAIYVSHKSNGGKLNDIANTLETAYTVAEAAALLADANNDFSQQVYVKGKVCKYTFNSNYKNQNIYISDNGEETPNFEFYQCYGLDGEDIVSEDYLKLGDEVIGVGYLTTYNSQNEFSKGCHLVSINGKTSSNISEVEMGQGQKNIFDLQGRRVNNAIKGVYVVNGKKVIF